MMVGMVRSVCALLPARAALASSRRAASGSDRKRRCQAGCRTMLRNCW